nr:MAG TPA: minor tail protein [Bacteriophage sp.]
MANSDIIKIGFDYRASLEQFEKETNGVFDGISNKAGKQKITIQLDAKDDKVIDKIKELQKLKLDKFTFEFGDSGLKEQLQTFDKLESKINEIISLSKGIGNSSVPIVDVNKSSKEIDKLESKISELTKKYDELQKKSTSGGISGKEVNLVDNDEFKKLSQEVSELKGQFDDLKTHMQLLDNYTVPTDRFFELQTQVEATSVKVSDLVDEMTRLSNIQKNIGQKTNISSASTESATNSIKEENNVLEQNTQKIKENTQAKEQNANVNLNKYDKRLDSYNGKIDKYKTTIDRFNDGGWTSSTYLENVQAVKNAVHEYETLLNELKGKDASLVTSDDINRLDNYEKKIKDTIATVTNMSASEKGYNFVSGQKELDKIHKLLAENSKMSSEAKAKIRAYYSEIESGNPSMSLDKIHGEILKIYNAEVEAGRAGRTLFDTLKNSGFHQIAAQMAGMFGVYDVINGLKQVASTVINMNTQITDLAKVSEATSSQIYDDFSSYADIAKDIGGTISDTISATADWSRNGYNLPDSKELARVALLYKNVGDGIDIDSANKSLISTLRGFKMEADEAEKIIDIFNNVSNNEPIDSGGIGEALQRSAASFNAANTSLQESVALISTTNSVIQNPEKVGNMWKVVSMRIRSATSELEQAGEDTDGLVTSTADLQKMIKAMTGYDILESDGKTFKSIYDIVLNISKVWNNLSDLDQSSLLQALAGKQQSNALAAALSNPELLEKSYQEAMDSAGSAAEEEKKYQQSVQYSIDQTKAKLEELSADLLSSDFLKGAIDAGGKLIEVLDGIVKSGNAIPAVATAIAAAFSFKNVG